MNNNNNNLSNLADNSFGYDSIQFYLKLFTIKTDSVFHRKRLIKLNGFRIYPYKKHQLITIHSNVSHFNAHNQTRLNLYPGQPMDFKACIRSLCSTLQQCGLKFRIEDLRISKLDININIRTPFEASFYLKYFSDIPRTVLDHKYSNSLYYFSKSKKKRKCLIKIYDKTEEIKSKHQVNIDTNLLRFEITLKRKSMLLSVAKKMGCNLVDIYHLKGLATDKIFNKLKLYSLDQFYKTIPLEYLLKENFLNESSHFQKSLLKIMGTKDIELIMAYNTSNPINQIRGLNNSSLDTMKRKEKRLGLLLRKIEDTKINVFKDQHYGFLKSYIVDKKQDCIALDEVLNKLKATNLTPDVKLKINLNFLIAIMESLNTYLYKEIVLNN